MAKPQFQCRYSHLCRKLLLGWYLALVPAICLALDPARSLFQYNCLNWTHQDGLPVNRVSSITQSRDGYLWLGTQKGLVRFDGTRFMLVSLPTRPEFPGQSVSCLSSSRQGGVWFGVNGGSIGLHDEYGFASNGADEWAQFGNNVLSIRQASDGAIWAGLDTGLLKVVPGKTNATSFLDTIPNCTSI